MLGFRKKIFHETNKGSKLSLEQGHGYYDQPVSLGCITTDNLCNKPGTETFVEKCIPHPDTGKGCFNEDTGTMTFKSKTTTKSCTKECVNRSFNLTESQDFETESSATNDTTKDNTTKKLFYKGVNKVIDPYYGIDYTDDYFGKYNATTNTYDMKTYDINSYPICIPKEYTGYYQLKYTCSSLDSVGLDACKYTCGTHKTISFNGERQQSNENKDVIMRYPFYIEENGEKYYYCYDQLGNNLIAPLYESGKVDSNFTFPKVCYSRYITDFNQNHKTTSSVTYNSSFISLGVKLTLEDSDLPESTGLVNLPTTFSSDDNSIMVANIGQEFMKVNYYGTGNSVNTLKGIFILYSKTEITGLTRLNGFTFDDYLYLYKFDSTEYTEYTVNSVTDDGNIIFTSNFGDTNPKYGFFEGNSTIVQLTYVSGTTWTSKISIDKLNVSSTSTFYHLSQITESTSTSQSFVTKSILLSGKFTDIANINDHTFKSSDNSVYNNQEIELNMNSLYLPNTTTKFVPYSPKLIFGGIYEDEPTEESEIDIKTGLTYTIYIDTSITQTDINYINVDRDFFKDNNVRMTHQKNKDVYFFHNLSEKISDFTEFMSPYIKSEDNIINACYDEQNKKRPDGYVVNLEPGETMVVNIESKDYNLNYSNYGYDSAECGIYGYKDSEGVVQHSHNNSNSYQSISISSNPRECSISPEDNTDNSKIENMFKLGISSDTSENKLGCFSSFSKDSVKRSCDIPNIPTKYSSLVKYEKNEIVYKELNNGQYYISMLDNNRSSLSKPENWRQVNVFTSLLEYMYRRELIMSRNISQFYTLRNDTVSDPIRFSGTSQFSWDVFSVKNSGINTLNPSRVFKPYITGSDYFPDKYVDVTLNVNLSSDSSYPFSSSNPSITKPFHMDLVLNKLLYRPNDVNADLENQDNNTFASETLNNTWRKFGRGLTEDNFDWKSPFQTTNGDGNWVYGLRFDARPDIIFNHNRKTLQYNGKTASDYTEYYIDKNGMRTKDGDQHYPNYDNNYNGKFGRRFTHDDDKLVNLWFKYTFTYNENAINKQILVSSDYNFEQGDLIFAYKEDGSNYYPDGTTIQRFTTDSDGRKRLTLSEENIQIIPAGTRYYIKEKAEVINNIKNKAFGGRFGIYRSGDINSDNSNSISLANDINSDNSSLISLVTSGDSVGAQSFSERWFPYLTNKVRTYFYPYFVPDPTTGNFGFKDFGILSEFTNAAEKGNTMSFKIPLKYLRTFKIGDGDKNEIDLVDYNYTLKGNNYENHMSFNFFIENHYEYNPDDTNTTKYLDILKDLSDNKSNNSFDLDIVPLFGSISLKDDTNVNDNVNDKINIATNIDSVYSYEDGNHNKLINDYEKDYSSKYDLDNDNDNDNDNDRTQLWKSQSVKTNEIIIGRIDEGDDNGDYRLVMLQKNEDFSDLDLYFNYPRPSSVFSLPEAEPLAIRPNDYCNVYCYVNNIESLYSVGNGKYDTGFIHIGPRKMYFYGANDSYKPSLSSIVDSSNKQYWNKTYLPFFQSTSQTTYSRFSKIFPGKLIDDSWSGNQDPGNYTNTGDYLINKYTLNKISNDLVPIYGSNPSDNKYIWYTTSTTNDNDEVGTGNSINGDTYYEIEKYNETRSFDIPTDGSPSNDPKWRTYLDNLWSPPAVLMGKDYEFLSFPDNLNISFSPDQSDDNFVQYQNHPFYWLSNLRQLNENYNVEFYNDIIRSIFWGNPSITEQNFMGTPYTSKLAFKEDNTDDFTIQKFTNPLFGNTNPTPDSLNVDLRSNEIFDAIEVIGKSYDVYNTSSNFQYEGTSGQEFSFILTTHDDPLQIIDGKYRNTESFVDNLYGKLKNEDTFYIVPLISSYADVDDTFNESEILDKTLTYLDDTTDTTDTILATNHDNCQVNNYFRFYYNLKTYGQVQKGLSSAIKNLNGPITILPNNAKFNTGIRSINNVNGYDSRGYSLDYPSDISHYDQHSAVWSSFYSAGIAMPATHLLEIIKSNNLGVSNNWFIYEDGPPTIPSTTPTTIPSTIPTDIYREVENVYDFNIRLMDNTNKYLDPLFNNFTNSLYGFQQDLFTFGHGPIIFGNMLKNKSVTLGDDTAYQYSLRNATNVVFQLELLNKTYLSSFKTKLNEIFPNDQNQNLFLNYETYNRTQDNSQLVERGFKTYNLSYEGILDKLFNVHFSAMGAHPLTTNNGLKVINTPHLTSYELLPNDFSHNSTINYIKNGVVDSRDMKLGLDGITKILKKLGDFYGKSWMYWDKTTIDANTKLPDVTFQNNGTIRLLYMHMLGLYSPPSGTKYYNGEVITDTFLPPESRTERSSPTNIQDNLYGFKVDGDDYINSIPKPVRTIMDIGHSKTVAEAENSLKKFSKNLLTYSSSQTRDNLLTLIGSNSNTTDKINDIHRVGITRPFGIPKNYLPGGWGWPMTLNSYDTIYVTHDTGDIKFQYPSFPLFEHCAQHLDEESLTNEIIESNLISSPGLKTWFDNFIQINRKPNKIEPVEYKFSLSENYLQKIDYSKFGGINNQNKHEVTYNTYFDNLLDKLYNEQKYNIGSIINTNTNTKQGSISFPFRTFYSINSPHWRQRAVNYQPMADWITSTGDVVSNSSVSPSGGNRDNYVNKRVDRHIDWNYNNFDDSYDPLTGKVSVAYEPKLLTDGADAGRSSYGKDKNPPPYGPMIAGGHDEEFIYTRYDYDSYSSSTLPLYRKNYIRRYTEESLSGNLQNIDGLEYLRINSSYKEEFKNLQIKTNSVKRIPTLQTNMNNSGGNVILNGVNCKFSNTDNTFPKYFRYNPIISSGSQDPYMWNTSNDAVQVNMGLKNIGFDGIDGNYAYNFSQRPTYDYDIKPWASNARTKMSDYNSQNPNYIIDLEIRREDPSLSHKIFGHQQNLTDDWYDKFNFTNDLTFTIGNPFLTNKTDISLGDTSINFSQPKYSHMYYKTNSQDGRNLSPYYNYYENNQLVTIDPTGVDLDSKYNEKTGEPTVPSKTYNMYQFFNFYLHFYKKQGGDTKTVEDIFNNTYYGKFVDNTDKTSTFSNMYSNFSNLTGRSFIRQSDNNKIVTAYITPNMDFRMNTVNLKSKFKNKFNNPNDDCLGLSSYVSQNMYTDNTGMDSLDFIPTQSQVVNTIYGNDGRKKFGPGTKDDNGRWDIPGFTEKTNTNIGTLNYYNRFKDIDFADLHNINTTNNTLVKKHDEKLSITTCSDTYKGILDSVINNTNYFASDFTNSVSPIIDGNLDFTDYTDYYINTTNESTYKIIAVTNLLNEDKAYTFENYDTSSTGSGISGAEIKEGIWHFLDIDEDYDFNSMLFYKYTKPDSTTDSQMIKSNFIRENGKLKLRTDVTDAWSNVNDVTPYNQLTPLGDTFLPAYGCLPMSGGKMVWSEITPVTNYMRELNGYFDNLRGDTISEYKLTRYTMKSTPYTTFEDKSTNTFIPLIQGFNVGGVKNITVKGNFPELTKNHGIYFSKNFFDKSFSDIFPDVAGSLQRAINPFQGSTKNYFYRSSNITPPQENEPLTLIEMNFYNSGISDEDYDLNPKSDTKETESINQNKVGADIFFTREPGVFKVLLGYPKFETQPITNDYSEYISYSKIQDITPPSSKQGTKYLSSVSSDIQFGRIGGERFFYTSTYSIDKLQFRRDNNTKIFDGWETSTSTYTIPDGNKSLTPIFIDGGKTITITNSTLDLRDIFDLPVTPTFDSSKIALNDIRNFVERLTPGDIIKIKQYKKGANEYEITVSSKISSNPYAVKIQESYVNDESGKKILTTDGNDIKIETQFTYVCLFLSRFNHDGSAKNAITLRDMEFTDGVVFYQDIDNYEDFEVLSPSILIDFNITNSISLDDVKVAYNPKFNIVLSCIDKEPTGIIDVFGTNRSFIDDSYSIEKYELNKTYRKYQILYNTEKENVFFKSNSNSAQKGNSPFEIETTGNELQINYDSTNWKIVNVDSNKILDNKGWKPYHRYRKGDVVYRERMLLPYIDHNVGVSFSEKSKIVPLLSSTYPYKLYNDDYQNLQYYQAKSLVGTNQDMKTEYGEQDNSIDPLFYKKYTTVDIVEEFKFDPKNIKEYGNICSTKNFVSLTQETFDTNDYRGCDKPLSIYSETDGVITFNNKKMIENNFIKYITLGGLQNFTLNEISGFFSPIIVPFSNGDSSFTNGGNTYNLIFREENLFNVKISDDFYYINEDINDDINEENTRLTLKIVTTNNTTSENFRKCIINQNGDFFILYHPFTTQKEDYSDIYYIARDGSINNLLVNGNIEDSRIIACCKPNKQIWEEYNVDPNSISSENSFIRNSRDMYRDYKANFKSLSYITQTDDISNSITTPDGVILYYSTVSEQTNNNYDNIVKTQKYFVEKLIGGVNMYITNLSLMKDTTYYVEEEIDGYDIKFYTTGSNNNITRTKPTNMFNIDTVYYSKINYNSQGPYYLFTYDGREGMNFSQTKPCMNFNLNPTTDDLDKADFSDVLGSFVSAKVLRDDNDKILLLSLPNSPCNYSENADEYPISYLGDCKADIGSEMLSQVVSYIPLEKDSDNNGDPGLSGKSSCTGEFLQSNKFELSNSLLLYFVPLEKKYQSTDPRKLNCRIMTFFGTEFVGWLKYNRSIEVKRDFEVDLSTGNDPSMTPLFVSYTNLNILNTKKQTKVLIGNKPIHVDLYDNIEESNAYYTTNFKDEDIFTLVKNNGKYNIEKLSNEDNCFVVDGVIDDFTDNSSRYSRNKVVNADYKMVDSILTPSINSTLQEGSNYLVNFTYDTNYMNGIYTYKDGKLVVHDDFNTFDKIIENQLIKYTELNYIYHYRLSMDSNGQISITQPSDFNNVTIVDVSQYYPSTPNPIPSGGYIVNNVADVNQNGYFIRSTKQTIDSQTIFNISSSSTILPNTYWSYDINSQNILFTDVTYMFNNLGVLTNRSNELETQPLVGKVKFRKEYSNATAYGLNNLTLTPMYKQSDIVNNNNLITQLGRIRESRLPGNIGTENDCSLFFSFNPFSDDPTRHVYKLVRTNNIVKLETVTNISLSNITTSENIESDLQYNFKYRIDQDEQDLTKGVKLSIRTDNDAKPKISVIVTYFSNVKFTTVNKETLNFDENGNQTSGYSPIFPIYEKSLNGQNDSYILFEPIKNINVTSSFFIDVKYGDSLVDTFTVS